MNQGPGGRGANNQGYHGGPGRGRGQGQQNMVSSIEFTVIPGTVDGGTSNGLLFKL